MQPQQDQRLRATMCAEECNFSMGWLMTFALAMAIFSTRSKSFTRTNTLLTYWKSTKFLCLSLVYTCMACHLSFNYQIPLSSKQGVCRVCFTVNVQSMTIIYCMHDVHNFINWLTEGQLMFKYPSIGCVYLKIRSLPYCRWVGQWQCRCNSASQHAHIEVHCVTNHQNYPLFKLTCSTSTQVIRV